MSSSNIRSAAFVPTTLDYAKAKAKHLRKLLANVNATVSLAEAQQLTAKALGHPDWHALDNALKAHVPASPLLSALTPEEQSFRWMSQRDALLQVDGLALADLADVLSDWDLAGAATAPSASVTEVQIAQALTRAWPTDERRIRQAVYDSVAYIVQNSLRTLNAAGGFSLELRSATLADILHLEYQDPHNQAGIKSTPRSSVQEALRKKLTTDNGETYALQAAVSTALLGAKAMYRPNASALVIGEMLTDRLYQMALSDTANQSLWDLFFVPANKEGLTQFYNSGENLDPSDWRGDAEEDENEFDEDEGYSHIPQMPEHAATVVERILPKGLTLSLRQTPDFNEYDDDFRVTSILAMLRTAGGANVGFLRARLFESRRKRISGRDFFVVADSLDQETMEMAEALWHHVPNFHTCFGKGALLNVGALELSKGLRSQGYAEVLLEAVLAHGKSLAGRVGALYVDVSPSQLPWISFKCMPAPILEETRRVSAKLRAHALALLERPALKEVPFRFLRMCYPDNIAERVK